LRPFVYGWTKKNDPVSLRRIYVENPEERYALRFFVHGKEYKLFNFVRTDLHLVSVEEGGTLFLFGTDKLGRDMFSRTLHGASISLSVGLLGVALSFVFGSLVGGVSGFYGGWIDTLVQRVIEFVSSIPTVPLWMALSAALPRNWPPLRIYFGITIILSFQGWTGLARAVRGKLLELREEDFVMAARLSGASDGRIILSHLLPAFLSYLIVSVTLAIPGMILGETSLSFLNLGLRPPVVSWGVLLQQAQNVRTLALQPWLLIPALFIVLTVLSFNALGDGLRDAADPYK
jgi:peptide/nickel transport system permease protein